MRAASDSSRRLTLVFAAVLLPAAATLVWLGFRLVEQDRALSAQRDVERREAAADAVVRSLSQFLADAERRLAAGLAVDQAITIERVDGQLSVAPRSAVAWYPTPRALPELPLSPFSTAESQEYRGDTKGALATYRVLAKAAEPGVRAGALLRLARVRRNSRANDAALRDYRALSHYSTFALDGMPVDLVARRAICSLHEQAGRRSELKRDAAAIEADLLAGRWDLGRASWELSASQLAGWLGRPVAVPPEAVTFAIAADWFRDASLAPSGRRIVTAEKAPVTLIWDAGARRAVALGPTAMAGGLASATALHPPQMIRTALLNERGEFVAGDLPSGNRRVSRRSSADSGLPWTVMLAPGTAWDAGEEFGSRRGLYAIALVAIGLLLGGGAYLLWRVVQRELAVARLQAEFVSTVSHEFRTPVTSLKHMIELLQEDDEVTLDRRKSHYDVLSRSTERLHRLVESLLDFGRMEEGRKPYDLQAIDPTVLASDVAREFARDPVSRGYAIDVMVDVGAPEAVLADSEALRHAIWNLLDNAVKYSPGGSRVTLSVGPHEAGASIAVRDHGVGVPAAERGDIFLKFVRGAKAQRLGIKGAGIGLAIVSHIMRAHGGSVELESEEGSGSTFRLVLPNATS